MNLRLRRASALAPIVLLFVGSAAVADPPAETYTSQRSTQLGPSWIHSGFTTDGGGTVWDNLFADMVNALGAYNEIAFAFNQCYGGGMIDELTDNGVNRASYTSAARHNQRSWSRPEPTGQWESTYNVNYAPKAGSANPQTQRAAAKFARANDFRGPFGNQAPTEDPQYTSSGRVGDDITLHRNSGSNPTNNNAYKAILFGGSGARPLDIAGNTNSLARMVTNLTAAGYAAGDIRALARGNPVQFRPTFKNLATAWKDVRAVATATTQIFYWNSWGHGTRMNDSVKKRQWDDLG
ncbi:MAG: hypothetical protein ACREJC_02605, partial [Tepidisphaeraceae bacterium]